MGREVHCSYFRIYMSGNAPCLTYFIAHYARARMRARENL